MEKWFGGHATDEEMPNQEDQQWLLKTELFMWAFTTVWLDVLLVWQSFKDTCLYLLYFYSLNFYMQFLLCL